MKLNFENLKVNYVDIELMKKFIEYYEDSQKYCDEYNELCKEIRKEYNIPKEKTIIDEINKKINRNLIEKSQITDEDKYNKLEQEYQELMKNYNQLKQYKKIIEINRNFDENTIKQYDKNKTEYKTEFEKQKSGIRIMYINIKYLYQIYRSIFEYNINKKESKFIKKIKLKKTLKQIKPIISDSKYNFANMENIEKNIELFNSYSDILEQFNENEGPKITQAIHETQTTPSEIKIDDHITIITKRNNTKHIYDEEPSYTKTKSA